MSSFHRNTRKFSKGLRGKVLPANKKKTPEVSRQVHKPKSFSAAIARREAKAVQVIIQELRTPGYDASEGDLISVVKSRVNLHNGRIASLIHKLVNNKFLVDVSGSYRRGVRIFKLKASYLNRRFQDLCQEIYRKIFGFRAQQLSLV